MKTTRLLSLVLISFTVLLHADTDSTPIPFAELGAKATADYTGDAIGITITAEGARLLTGFQKLAGKVTAEGLALESTETGGGILNLRASALGRTDTKMKNLASIGTVTVEEKLVRWIRPSLVEEYSVSADGVRQDFIVPAAPVGTGELSLELALIGAHAEAQGEGVRLTLTGSGRELIYAKLQVVDATGRALTAQLQVINPERLAVRVQDAGAVYPIRIDPTFSDADWVSMNPGFDGTNGEVAEAVVDASGNLYIGGLFTIVGTVKANNIAKWNGSTWSALGSGIDGLVGVLTLSGNTLYAGGRFTTAGGTVVNKIAKWDGSIWSALSTGVDGDVSSLAVIGSDLYVGGVFTTAGGTVVNKIAKWNGTTWSALGSGIGGVDVSALAVIGTNLYAGGFFTNAGGISVNNIAKWNGSTWSALGLGMDGDVSALAVSGSILYAGGGFSTAGGTPASCIAKWNGSAWAALGSGIPSNVIALAVSGSNLYAGGLFVTAGGIEANFIAKWNGSNWSALGSGMDGYVYTLLARGSDLYVGGRFGTASGKAANNIAKYNGGTWSAFGSGINGSIHALAMHDSDLYIGGYFTRAGSTDANSIAKWNGSEWSALGAGINGQVNDIAMSGGYLYAGGSFFAAGGKTINNIAKWDGIEWSPLGTGVEGNYDGSYVTAMQFINSILYVGGYFVKAGGTSVNNIAKWNGSEWAALGSGISRGGKYTYISALTSINNSIYAGGYFTSAGGISVNNIAKWNGTTWSALDTGVDSSVFALLVNNGELYAGGLFTTAGGISASRIAKWNGVTWSALGAGVNGTVNAITENAGNIYAGGSFTTAGGIPASCIAKWNDSEWSALGSGLDNGVYALEADTNGHLYAGGLFTNAGSTLSPFIARANLNGEADIAVEQQAQTLTDQASYFRFDSIDVAIGSNSKLFTIRNTGTTTLHLTGTSLVTLSGSSSFTISVQPSTPLLAGDSTTFEVAFDPTTAGVHRATVSIANDDPDEGPFTFTVIGTGLEPTLTQTITFAPPATVYQGQSPLALTAEASSGLPVALRVVSGPANLSGGALTLTGAGTVKVEATQAGGGRYKAAATVVKTITVKADPTVLTLINLSQRYDGTPKPISTLGGTATIMYKVGANFVTTPPTDAGSYAVKAGTKTGTLIITKAPLYVTPDDKRRFSGQANPALTYTITGYLGSDNASDLTKAPVLTTTATPASVGGLYPITASAATALNYSFTYLQGTMMVESFAGSYEALLMDGGSKPVGKLNITVAATSKSFTARLATATENSAVPFSGPLLNIGEQANGNATTLFGTEKTRYRIEFTLPIAGDAGSNALRSGLPLGSANDGKKISIKTVAYAGAHTAVLEPATPTGNIVPAGAGWATATISTTGVMTLAGKLGDGTGFTSTLNPDDLNNPGYRLFLQPYLPARTQSFLAGSFTLAEHPRLTGRRYLAQSNLTWKKIELYTDTSYRTDFGPVNTVMMIDPWLAPKTTVPSFTLAQRLGLTGTSISFGVTHSATGSDSQSDLPTRLSLSTTNAVSVLTPSANLTKWKTLSFVPTTGTFTGSFELSDAIKRPVTFSGVLRQPTITTDPLIGEGHYSMPSLTGTEKTTGEIMFTRP